MNPTVVHIGNARLAFERQLDAQECKRRWTSASVTLGQSALLVIFVGAWQLAVSYGYANPVFVGSPVDIARELWINTTNGLFFREGWPTLKAVVVAFTLASVVGIGAGILLHELPVVSRIVSPFIAAFNGMPRIALAPITIVWFGLGMASKVALAFSIVVFIELITTQAALRNVDTDLQRLCKSLGVSRLRKLFAVQLPWALPSIFAGLRLGFLYAVISVIVNEIISAPDGIGSLIALYTNTFQISKMFATLVFVSTFTILVDTAMQKLELRLKVW